MEVINIYGIGTGGSFLCLVLLRVAPYLMSLTGSIFLLTSKHLTYPYILSRHRLLGPWTRADVLLYLSYGATNVFLVIFRVPSAAGAGHRAGNLALANIAFNFFALHLSFLADILGISLRSCRRIHQATGWMAGLLAAFHVFIALVVQRVNFSLQNQGNLSALVVS